MTVGTPRFSLHLVSAGASSSLGAGNGLPEACGRTPGGKVPRPAESRPRGSPQGFQHRDPPVFQEKPYSSQRPPVAPYYQE